jgi:3-oxoacyl-[acyl-carrier-protein] synthase II
MSSRIVITGLGLVTPLGSGHETTWRAFLAGANGIGPVRSFATDGYTSCLGAEIHDFDPAPALRRVHPETIGRASQLAAVAARLALADAGLEAAADPTRAGVALGTTSGEPQEIERFDDCWLDGAPERAHADFVNRYRCASIPEVVAAEVGFCGPNIMIPTACAAGSYAIAYAFDTLRAGRADMMLAGGADCFSRITYSGFSRLGAIAAEHCRPFDRNRQGMVPGEGAGVLALETWEHANRRGARVYAEVVGYGLSCDAHHMTGAHPEGDGAARAMRQALRDSGRSPADVSYISAHGTGTPTNDRLETAAVRRVFGAAADGVPMSSVKSMIGHTMGAASAIESAVCALAIHQGRVPPTINLVEPDPECDLDYVANRARDCDVDLAMNNAYAFGGNNASVLFARCAA